MGGQNQDELRSLIVDRVYRGVWWIGCFATICFCVNVIGNTYVKVQENNPVVQIATLVAGLIGTLSAPSLLFLKMERRYRTFIENFSTRLTRIEGKIDPNRTSSGLNVDGTDPSPKVPS